MPGDRCCCCGIQAKSSLLPSPGAQRGPEHESHSLQLSRDPLFPAGPDHPPTSCHISAKTHHSSFWQRGHAWSLGLSKTLMVSGGSYSNNLPSPLSVHLQLCLGIATLPGHHSCHYSDTCFSFPQSCREHPVHPKVAREAVGHHAPLWDAPFLTNTCKWKKKEEFPCSGREARASRCWMCSAHSIAQTHVEPRIEMRAQPAREEVWLCPCHAQGFAQCQWGPCKASLSPVTSPSQPHCLRRSKASPELRSLL